MGNDEEFSNSDLTKTERFIKRYVKDFSGERVLDICGGLGRNSELLAKRFKKIDILDLKPDFSNTPLDNQGTLIEANLKDID